MLKTWRNRLKIKNNNRFLSNTWGITLLLSIFDVLTINGKLYWKRGRIDLRYKRLNSFLVNTSSLSQIWFKLRPIVKPGISYQGFTSADFAPSSVTDRPLQVNNGILPISSAVRNQPELELNNPLDDHSIVSTSAVQDRLEPELNSPL